MARRSKKDTVKKVKSTATGNNVKAYIAGSGVVVDEPIVDTLEKNYMPYAMSVIVSRALPEIDGFKPSHRKLLYTMYKMGLLTGAKTKSANIVGQTMKLNPHGDAAIYETMVRLARGNEALLHPYVDSKGNFGKAYSRDMAYAASRYTEAKLDPICNELFRDIDKDTVDFVPNYDNTMTEPTLFPATYPSVLVNANMGIAVSMASSVCSFNLAEVCDTTIGLLKSSRFNITETLKGPDFSGGGFLVYDEDELEKVYRTGRGSLKVRARYQYDKSANCIEVVQIPPTTTVEAIMDKIIELTKSGKIREVSYIRDETDINGLKLAIDIKRGVDPDKLMRKLFKLTPLQDSFSCNFNILISGTPKVMGVYEILEEWIAFRQECIKRRTYFERTKKSEKLHLLLGLQKILLDIDKAIRIVRETAEETEVVPNLMKGFKIDEIQAEYVAEIKLRQLNKEYILKRIADIETLQKEIAEMDEILGSEKKIKAIIVSELKEVKKKYGQPRKTMFYYSTDEDDVSVEEEVPDYPVNVFLTRDGYFKKITMQSLRVASEQKIKDGDEITTHLEVTNRTELLFFTNQHQVYKTRGDVFNDTKASELGDFIPVKLGFDEFESVVDMVATTDYSGYVIIVFTNGKVAKVPLNAYETKNNRKKLTNAYTDKADVAQILYATEGTKILIKSTNGRAVVINTDMLTAKTSRVTVGVQVLTLKNKAKVEQAYVVSDEDFADVEKYFTQKIPVAGAVAKALVDKNQLKV